MQAHARPRLPPSTASAWATRARTWTWRGASVASSWWRTRSRRTPACASSGGAGQRRDHGGGPRRRVLTRPWCGRWPSRGDRARLQGISSAVFAPDVGMVGCSLRHRGEELLGQRGGLAKYRESGSSFSIPSCIRRPTGSTGRSTRLAFVSIQTASITGSWRRRTGRCSRRAVSDSPPRSTSPPTRSC